MKNIEIRMDCRHYDGNKNQDGLQTPCYIISDIETGMDYGSCANQIRRRSIDDTIT